MKDIVDKDGFIINPLIRDAYNRICESKATVTSYSEKVDAAEAFLKLMIRLPEDRRRALGYENPASD